MANSALNLTSLDFPTLKQNLITFLQSQTAFKDYDYADSNMNVLLDVLSYNSYLNSFYLNLTASEMFLDSAQKLDSIVSHSKELNYLPTSYQSSEASVSFTVSTSGVASPLTIPKNTRFFGSNANGLFTFVTDQTLSYVSTNSTFSVSNLSLHEGIYMTDAFVIDYTVPQQQFVLSNQKIDVSSLSVVVTENDSNTVFRQATNLFGLGASSNVYFMQAAQNQLYEVLFGDGLFGRYPINGAVITCEYRVCHGTDADGISSLTCTTDLGPINGGSATIAGLTVTANSSSSANAESIESIRFRAPRYYATQERAVSSDDYSSLVMGEFGGQVADVSVVGGDQLTPPQYGYVAVYLKPTVGTVAPDYLKNSVSNYLLPYVSVPTRVLMMNPTYLYAAVRTRVTYLQNQTTLLSGDVASSVMVAILGYSSSNLGKFGSALTYSKLCAAIDGTDASIVGNDTTVLVSLRISPLLSGKTSYHISFSNTLTVQSTDSLTGFVPGSAFYAAPVVTSSSFTFVDASGVQWPFSFIRDDCLGNLIVYTDVNGKFLNLGTVGTVDYATGDVVISDLVSSYYGDYISLYGVPAIPDIAAGKQFVLEIESSDVSIQIVGS